MRDHVNLRAWLSLRRRQEYNEEKSDGQTINFLISSFPAAARTVLVLSNVTSAGFAPSWQMTSPKPNQVQSAARDEQRRKIAKGEAADNGGKFAETPSPGLMARKKLDDVCCSITGSNWLQGLQLHKFTLFYRVDHRPLIF